MYEYTDARLEKLRKETRALFDGLKTMPFDELTVIKRVTEAFEKSDKKARRCFEDILEYYLIFGFDEGEEKAGGEKGAGKQKGLRDKLKAGTDKTREKAAALLEDILSEYDAVTGYQYGPEVERKKARLIEAVLSARQSTEIPKTGRAAARKSKGKSARVAKAIETALRYWLLQLVEYAVKGTDRGVLEGYREAGIQYVRWTAQKDERVCAICDERDGKIYALDAVPPKPHYNCRCWLEAVIKK